MFRIIQTSWNMRKTSSRIPKKGTKNRDSNRTMTIIHTPITMVGRKNSSTRNYIPLQCIMFSGPSHIMRLTKIILMVEILKVSIRVSEIVILSATQICIQFLSRIILRHLTNTLLTEIRQITLITKNMMKEVEMRIFRKKLKITLQMGTRVKWRGFARFLMRGLRSGPIGRGYLLRVFEKGVEVQRAGPQVILRGTEGDLLTEPFRKRMSDPSKEIRQRLLSDFLYLKSSIWRSFFWV